MLDSTGKVWYNDYRKLRKEVNKNDKKILRTGFMV